MPVFAPMLKATDPLPLPDAPDVTVSQGALLVAVHEQSSVVVTADEPVPPPAAIDCDDG